MILVNPSHKKFMQTNIRMVNVRVKTRAGKGSGY